jgi:hypothetical protein
LEKEKEDDIEREEERNIDGAKKERERRNFIFKVHLTILEQ